jgi:hypothetical protein
MTNKADLKDYYHRAVVLLSNNLEIQTHDDSWVAAYAQSKRRARKLLQKL